MALSHNVMMQHSIRGKVDAANEGPRYCVACHLTDDALANWGPEYDTFRAALGPAGDLGDLDFAVLQAHIGQNPGNQLNSPLWVHMVAGLGSGLFLFDERGYPVNPLDHNDDRVGGDGQSPADVFDLGNVFFDLDRLVEADGSSNASNNHPMNERPPDPDRRDGAQDPNLSGPLGAVLIQKLTDAVDGVVLDSWLDADGEKGGDLDD